MPKPLNTQDRLSQNGHYPSSQGLSQELLDINKPNQTSSTELKSSESVSDDWSSLTKELIDTLPRVWTRGLLYWLVVFAAIVLPWAMLSKVDETGSARGRLEPQGKTIRLDAPVAGKVSAIKIKEGQLVRRGQSLLVLESEEVLSELQQAQARLEGQRDRLPLLELMKKQLESTARTQQLQSQAQASAQLAQINQIRQQLSFHQTESNSTQELLAKDRDILGRYSSLRQQGIISVLQVNDAERTMIENRQRLQKAQSDLQQAQAELKKQQSTYQSILRQGELTVMESQRQIKEIQTQIAGLKAEIAQTKNQIQSLLFQLQQRVVNAPIDGIVFHLPIQSAGAVVQPSQIVAEIAPKGTSLMLKAKMAVPESGFLRVGQLVKLKFDAYPFQDYGVVQGHLRWISPDSKVEETPQGKVETFELEIALEQTYIQTSNKRLALTAGQTATAEVIVRQRRLIDFILDPFKKLQKGGIEL
ncbi:MAG: Hemolysin secretion protein D, plasmid [Chroococcidiopsis sp. SAG 2025]|uniref:HlyD family efflux transporter periplasmic adaptor subunit n=1 Tax=Chroococcidiopsis sp. SAG 2025 TaxID=171389 RepID=UPI0029374934|nr:HlyD family efflux transporter periplasmic adaptor subunit [Chroococcidiopsis sp. SAG 2025]MDV2998313.1 Hemolysin secretion protein D, plasmid [Chroococcidiopsis sp. SAG 2025]